MKSSAELVRKAFEYWPVKILAVAAALVLFLLNRISNLEERPFSVPLEVILSSELMPAAPYPRVVRVTLRGESDGIFLIRPDDIEAFVDLTEHSTEGAFKAPIQIRKTDTAEDVDPLEIRVDPMEVTISLERKLTRTLEIVPVFEGRAAQGFDLVRTTMVPTSVLVEGPRSVLEELTRVQTQPIDISGRRENFSVRVRIEELNPFVRLRGSEIVEVRGSVEEAVILETYGNVDVLTLGLPQDLALVKRLPSGTITVQGTAAILGAIKPEEVRMVVDASGLSEPGTYSLRTRPDLPRGTVVLAYEPQTVEVEIRYATPPAQPSPTASPSPNSSPSPSPRSEQEASR